VVRSFPRLTTAQLWEIVDPRFVDPRSVAALQQILDLADRDFEVGEEVIDLAAPQMRRFLSDHRLWTLLPPDAVNPPVRIELRHRQRTIAATQLRLRSAATEILDRFNEAGIESRVLKGLATGDLDYHHRLQRHTGDVDLAVRPGDLDRAVALLRKAGFRDHPNPFSEHLLYGWTLDAPNGVEVDLHTRLSRRSPLGDQLFRSPGEALTSLPGHGLDPAQRIVHAAGHFLIAPPGTRRMSGLIDVTRLHRRPDLHLDDAREFAASLGIESLVGAGLWLEAQLRGRSDILHELDRWRAPDWLERTTRLVPERRLVLDHLGRYREVPKGQRLRYLPTWLLPNRHQRKLLRQSMQRATGRLRKEWR